MNKKKEYLNGELSPVYGGTAKRTAVARKTQTGDHDQMVADNLLNYLQSHPDCNPKFELARLSTFAVRKKYLQIIFFTNTLTHFWFTLIN